MWDATRRGSWGEFEFARGLLNSKKILDAGCGNGRLNFWLARNNFRGEYFGIDASSSLVALARKNFPTQKFVTQNLRDLKKPNKFDAVFCVAVLHHLDRDSCKKAVRNFHVSLQKNGKIFATTWNLWQPRFWKFFLAQKLSRELEIPFAKKDSRRVHAFTRRELKKLFVAAGFKNVKVFYARHSKKSNFFRARNLIILAKK